MQENFHQDTYWTLEKASNDEFVEKKSRFIGYGFSVTTEEEALSAIESVRAIHSDAKHHVYAYQIGEQCQCQRSCDDGEPAGTGGRPVLEAIKRSNLKNTLIIVVRYFGGVLLGAGGLTRAYSKGAIIAITACGIVQKIPAVSYQLLFDYVFLAKVESYLRQKNYEITNRQFSDLISLEVLFPKYEEEQVLAELKNLTNGNLRVLLLAKDKELARKG